MALNFEALAGQLGIDVGPWVLGFAKAKAEAAKFNAGLSQALRGVNQMVNQVSTAFTAMAGAAGAAMTYAVAQGAQFEQTMARTRALLSGGIKDAGQLEGAMQKLTAQALDLGKATVFSDADAARAMSFFALAGFKAEQIIAAMPGTMDLAAAAAIDVGQAADITAKILRGMGLDVSQTTHLVDVLAKASTTANAPISSLGEAMKYVGPMAKVAGVSLENVTAAIQLLSDAGIQGEMAGTGLRGVLSALAQNSGDTRKEFEKLGVQLRGANGYLRPMADIIDDFNRRLDETGRRAELDSIAFNALGNKAGPAFAVLIGEGGKKLREYTAALETAGGTAQRIAAIQLATLSGSWQQLTGSLDTLADKVADKLSPALRGLLNDSTDLVNAKMDKWVAAVGTAWSTLLVPAVERVAGAFGKVYAMVKPMIDSIGGAILSLKDRAAALFNQLPPWAKNATLVAGSLLGLSTVLGKIGGAIPFVGGLFASLGGLLNPLNLLAPAFTAASGVVQMFASGVGMLAAGVGMVTGAVTGIIPALGAMNGGIMAVLGIVTSGVGPTFAALGTLLSGVLGALLSPVALITAAIVGIGAAVGVALARSETARAGLVAIFKAIATGVMALVGGALKIFKDFWAENKELITHVGEQVIWVFEKLLDLGKPVAVFLGKTLGLALKAVLWGFTQFFKIIEAVIGIFQGDWTYATALLNKSLATMIRLTASLVQGFGKLITLGMGDPFAGLADSMRHAADEYERDAARIDKAHENARKQKQLTADAKQVQADYKAEYNKRAAAAAKQAKDDRKARLDEGHSYGIVRLGANGIDEEPLSHDELAAIRKKRAKVAKAAAPAEGANTFTPVPAAAPAASAAAAAPAPQAAAPAVPTEKQEKAVADEAAQEKAWFDAVMKADRQTVLNTITDINTEMAALRKKLLDSGATQEQLAQLEQFRRQAVGDIQDIADSHGAAKEAAIRALQATVAAYRRANQQIVKMADDTEKKQEADDSKSAKSAERAAKRRAAVTATAQDGANGRRGRIAAMNQQLAAQPGPMQQVGGMANQISNMMGNAMGLAGQAGAEGHAALSNMLNTVTDPLQKLTVQITSLNAQLGMASINKTPGGTLDALRQQLSGLQHRRQMLVNKENSERAKAVTSAHEAQRQQQMEARYHEQNAHKDLNDNLSNLVIVGRRAVSSPVQITIEGVNDIRTAVDRIQLELKRRGWLPGHRATLETRKMW